MVSIKRKIEQGLNFEKAILQNLKDLSIEYGWLVLDNVYLPSNTPLGHTQIDILLFTQYRYFCIEAKDWNGTVKCSNTHNWTIEYDRTIKTLSPVHQNINHLNKLKKIIAPYKLEGAVCFNEFTEIINKVDFVYRASEFIENVKYYSTRHQTISSEEMICDYNRVLAESSKVKLLSILD